MTSPAARLATPRALWIILGVAFALRAGLALLYPGIAYPDEIFQYQEPARRLLTGHGIVTWEWVWHVRSWLIPGLVAPVMQAVRLLGGGPALYGTVMACLMSAASLPVVWVAWQWGREQAGRDGAIVAGALAALSFQLVYAASHLLADTVACDLLIPALFHARAYRRGAGTSSLAWGAALLGVLCYVRPQFAPPLLLPGISLLLAARPRGHSALCLAWGLGPLLALGGLDWLTLGLPFQSMWLYAYVNLVKFPGEFAAEPIYWYVQKTALLWSVAVLPIAWFCWKGAKNFRLECATALLIVAMMSLIGHKETRFILAAHAILLILTGVGIGISLPRRRGIWCHPAPVVAVIGALSLLLSLFHPFLQEFGAGHGQLMITRRINRDPQACGLYIEPRNGLFGFPGYTGLRDGIALTSDRFDTPAANLRHANYITIRSLENRSPAVPAAYALLGCEYSGKQNKICLYHRPGGCDGGGASMGTSSVGEFPDNPVDNQ